MTTTEFQNSAAIESLIDAAAKLDEPISDADRVKPQYAPNARAFQRAFRAVQNVDRNWSRPELTSALQSIAAERNSGNDWTLGAVWRAQTGKIHTNERDDCASLFAAIAAGRIVPDRQTGTGPRGRIRQLESLIADAADALTVASSDARSLAKLRDAVASVATELVNALPTDADDNGDNDSDAVSDDAVSDDVADD